MELKLRISVQTSSDSITRSGEKSWLTAIDSRIKGLSKCVHGQTNRKENKVGGIVVGRGGSKIKQLENESGARIKFGKLIKLTHIVNISPMKIKITL